MVAKRYKEIYARLYNEVLNQGDLQVIDEIIHSNVTTHSPMPGQEQGVAGFKKTISDFREAFPDLKVVPQIILGEGDKVAGYFIVNGTHKGKFMNTPPTGKSFTYEEMVIVKFKGDRIIEHWSVVDAVSFMTQLGLIDSKIL
jgi:predicted ester cyclase